MKSFLPVTAGDLYVSTGSSIGRRCRYPALVAFLKRMTESRLSLSPRVQPLSRDRGGNGCWLIHTVLLLTLSCGPFLCAGHQSRSPCPITATSLMSLVPMAPGVLATLLISKCYGRNVQRPDDEDVGVYSTAAKALVAAQNKYRMADNTCWARGGSAAQGRSKFGAPFEEGRMEIYSVKAARAVKKAAATHAVFVTTAVEILASARGADETTSHKPTGCRPHPRAHFAGVPGKTRPGCGGRHR